jgi:hypothetical protein
MVTEEAKSNNAIPVKTQNTRNQNISKEKL